MKIIINLFIFRVIFLSIVLFLSGTSLHAADYIFGYSDTGSNNLPAGCSGSGGSYTCAGALALADGDTVTLVAPTTITMSAAFATTGNNEINSNGAHPLTLIVVGAFGLGVNSTLNATVVADAGAVAIAAGSNVTGSITTGAGAISIGVGCKVIGPLYAHTAAIAISADATVIGTITTSSGAISVGAGGNVEGDITTIVAGAIAVGAKAQVTGNLSVSSAAIAIGADANVTGSINVTVAGDVGVGAGAIVIGDFSVASGVINIGATAQVTGNLATTVAGAINIGATAQVTGNVTTLAGAVTLLAGSSVTGSIGTTVGSVTVGADTQVSVQIYTVNNDIITLGANAIVNSVCCKLTSNAVCVVNGSTLPMPPTCSIPTADYRFDECLWSSVSEEVKDSSGNGYNGTAFGVNTTELFKVINRSGDFSNDGTSDYLSLDYLAMNGLNDFSVGVWVKTSATSSQQEIIQALGSSTSDNEFELYLNGNDKIRINVQDKGKDFKVSKNTITDGNWHQIFLTRKSDTVCLYIDGNKKECQTGFGTGALSIREGSLIVGQEQDSYGGSFNQSQNFIGLIDELKIYSTQRTDAQVKTIYNHESIGKNYDGTQRAATLCISRPIADYRLDECSWDGLSGEVKDSSGNNYNGTAIHKANTESTLTAGGGIGYVGKFEYTNNQHIEIQNFRQLKDSRTITAWIKVNDLSKNGRIFADDKSNYNGDYALSYRDPGSGRVRFYIRGLTNVSLDSNQVIQQNTWYFIVAKFDSVAMKKDLYIYDASGNLKDHVSKTVSGTLNMSEGVASIGGELSSGSEADSLQFDGYIDEVKLFDTALNDTQIVQIYTNEKGKYNYDGTIREDVICPQAPKNILFDAWDIFKNIGDRTISTKNVSQNFDITIAALDELSGELKAYTGSVQARLVYSTTCPDGNDNITSFVDVDLTNQTKDITFSVEKAVKNARVQIKTDDNITCSTDNFAIRPDKFGVTLPLIGYAGDNFSIDFSASNSADYNETLNTSFIVEANISNSSCFNGALHVVPFSFENGLKNSVDASYSDVGDVTMTIKEKLGSEYALVDIADTSELDRLITPFSAVITILPYELNVTGVEYMTSTGQSWLYMLDVGTLSQKVKATIQANDKQHTIVQNFKDVCYAQDVYVLTNFDVINANSGVKIKYDDGTIVNIEDINRTTILPKTLFNTSKADVNYDFNIERDYKTPYNPIIIGLRQVRITSINLAKYENNATVDLTTSFYYGRVKTKDIRTNKTPINHNLDVEVYSQTPLPTFHQNSANWYVMGEDNATSVTMFPKKDFTGESAENKVTITNTKITLGKIYFDIANTWYKTNSAYVHVEIPQYLWYSRYSDYNSSGDCSTHPCFKYEYIFDSGNVGIGSGDFNGTTIGNDYNATKTKKGTRIFR